jgi:hypothetical protein
METKTKFFFMNSDLDLWDTDFKWKIPNSIYLPNTSMWNKIAKSLMAYFFFLHHNIVYSKSPVYNNLNGVFIIYEHKANAW